MITDWVISLRLVKRNSMQNSSKMKLGNYGYLTPPLFFFGSVSTFCKYMR